MRAVLKVAKPRGSRARQGTGETSLAAGSSAVGEVIWLLFATGEPVFE